MRIKTIFSYEMQCDSYAIPTKTFKTIVMKLLLKLLPNEPEPSYKKPTPTSQ